MSRPDSIPWYQWTGWSALDDGLVEFLAQRPGTIVWQISDLFVEGTTLGLSYELSTEPPLYVPPGWWLHFDGHSISAFERGPDHA